MKIVSNILENIQGIGNFYIIGLLIFFVFFGFIVFRTLRMSKKEAEDIKNSILD